MRHIDTAAIVIPIVVLIVLVVWIGAIYHANRHPPPADPAKQPAHEVTGGAFRAGGGRQVMPRRDDVPPEAAAEAPADDTASGVN